MMWAMAHPYMTFILVFWGIWVAGMCVEIVAKCVCGVYEKTEKEEKENKENANMDS